MKSGKRLSKAMVATGLGLGLLAGGAAGAILGSGGISGAATGQEETTTTVPADDAPGTTGRARAEERLRDALTPLVEDGTISEEQMVKVIGAIEAARPAGGWPGRGEGHGNGRGRGAGFGAVAKGEGLDAAAAALGMSPEDLRAQLRDGATLAEIAGAKGVEVQAVIDALVGVAKGRLDAKVAAGDLTREEADQRLATVTEKITDWVTDGRPGKGAGGGGDDQPGDDDGGD